MNTIKVNKVISYCDGINLFLGKDNGDNLYMVSFLEEDGCTDKFFAVECTKDQYSQYVNLRIDLHDIIMNRKSLPRWYKVSVPDFDYSRELELQEQNVTFPDDYLPPRSDLDAVRKAIHESEIQECVCSIIDSFESGLNEEAKSGPHDFGDPSCYNNHTPYQKEPYYDNSINKLAA